MTPKKPASSDILFGIFDVLIHSEKAKTIKDISSETGFYHSTIKHYLDMIQFIQSAPKVIIIPTGSSYQISLQFKDPEGMKKILDEIKKRNT